MVKFNPRLKQEIEKYRSYVIVVEGKKDAASLKSLGFERVYELHKNSIPLRERVEQIASELDKKDKVCILTDFDKEGKKIYLYVKPIFQELGVKLDSSFRGVLIKSGVSHIEGLAQFMKNLEHF